MFFLGDIFGGRLQNPVLHRANNIHIPYFSFFLIERRGAKQKGVWMAEMIAGWLTDWYLVIKSLHVISVIAWMAGLFYLPRLFVYHAEQVQVGSRTDTMFQVMERRLLRAIMNPAMIATWVFGLALVLTPGILDFSLPWVWAKAACVVAMTLFHMWLGKRRKEFAEGQNTRSGRSYRMMNEVPTVLMIVIVFAVITKF